MKDSLSPLQPVPGVAYVSDALGRHLPVVDVTHPAFAIDEDPLTWDRLIAGYEADAARRAAVPGWVQKAMLAVFLRRSVLARGMRRGGGRFLAGLDTYLFKVGPAFLDPAWSVPVDRVISSTLPGASVRWRLQDVAQLTASGLAEAARGTTGTPLVHLNLAGGPGADSWNTLLVLARDRPGVLSGRAVRIEVLDVDASGPAFGALALAALSGPGGPLWGVSAVWNYRPWDWNSSGGRGYSEVLGDGVGGATSEGGLFDYADDPTVLTHLKALEPVGGPGFFVVGTLTRNDGPSAQLNAGAGIPVVPRSLEGFSGLAASAGWRLDEVKTRPLYHAFRLKKNSIDINASRLL